MTDLTLSLLIVILYILGVTGRCACESQCRLKTENLNKRLVGHAVAEFSVPGHHDCARECLSLKLCKSIDYHTEERSCKLNDIDSMTVNDTEFETKSGAVFSDITDWPSISMNKCGQRPCTAKQKCVPSGEKYFCLDIGIDCGLPEIENGEVLLHQPGEHGFGSRATVICEPGYSATKVTILCQFTSKWEVATCEIDCGFPEIENGSVVLHQADAHGFGDKATVTCELGYYMIGDLIIVCQNTSTWTMPICSKATDCVDVLKLKPSSKSGVYYVKLHSSGDIIQVYCDMDTDGGGWTAFQHRFDNSVNFYRRFQDYENGFGDVKSVFWLGLKYIQEMTGQGTSELRIDVTTSRNRAAYVKYKNFYLSDGKKYRLQLSFVSGIADAMTGLRRWGFSTWDRDVDSSGMNCAHAYTSAWWFTRCALLNLNGYYARPGTRSGIYGGNGGMIFRAVDGYKSLKTSKMMFRRS